VGQGSPVVYDFIYPDEEGNYSYAPFPSSIPVPDEDISTSPQVVMCFSEAWLPAVLGALESLRQSDTFATEDPESLLQQVEALMVSMCNCGDFVTEIVFNIHTGKLSVRYGDSTELTEVTNITNTNTTIISPPPVMEQDNPRCTLSTFVRNQLEESIDQALDLSDNYTEIFEAVMEFIAAFGDWGVIIEAVEDAITVIVDVTTAWLRAALTDQWYDEVQCILHCLLPEENPTYDQTIFDQWVAEIAAKDTLGEHVSEIMVAYSQSYWQWVFWRAQFQDNEPSCAFCTECEEPAAEHQLIGDWGMVLTFVQNNPYGWGEDIEVWHYEIVSRNEPWNQLVGRFYASEGAKFQIIHGENQNHGWEIGYQGLRCYPEEPWSEANYTYFNGWNDGNLPGFGAHWRWVRCITDEYTPNPSVGDIFIRWEVEE
jgi:hypothetical protein